LRRPSSSIPSGRSALLVRGLNRFRKSSRCVCDG
jgi:hypothetical protein